MRRSTNSAGNQIISGVLFGTVTTIVFTLIGASICTVLIASEKIMPGDSGYCALGILLLASVIGSEVGARKVQEKRLYVCLLVACCYMLCLISITAMFFGGVYQGIGMNAFVVFTGSIVAVLLGMNAKKRTKQRKSKIRRR